MSGVLRRLLPTGLLSRLRPTTRGTGLASGGGALAVAGVLLGVPALVQVGLMALLVVVAGVVTVLLAVARDRRGGLRVLRTVVPHPLTVGEPALVTVDLTGRSGLDRVRVSESAARELSGAGALRARVTRSADRLRLQYSVLPTRRGRWSVGPVQVRRADLFGTVLWAGAVGQARRVPLRPAVTELGVPDGAAALDARASSGSRAASPDDTALRDYRPGDDLRRVHWRTTARLGELVVRQDERAGRRPATVLLDLPQDDEALEWTIRLGASAAVSLADAGHQVRLLAGPARDGLHHRDAASAELLLDQTIDLVAPPDRVTGLTWLIGGLRTLGTSGAGSELVVAVIGAVDDRTLADLSRVGGGHDGWAVVRTAADASAVEQHTVDGLRRGGWAVASARVGEDLGEAWRRLVADAVPATAGR